MSLQHSQSIFQTSQLLSLQSSKHWPSKHATSAAKWRIVPNVLLKCVLITTTYFSDFILAYAVLFSNCYLIKLVSSIQNIRLHSLFIEHDWSQWPVCIQQYQKLPFPFRKSSRLAQFALITFFRFDYYNLPVYTFHRSSMSNTSIYIDIL